MSESSALVNLGELSKPATVLIEKISDAIGGIFKPYQIRRVAKAEADAERIRAATQIEITELQQRALVRFLAEEAKVQVNIESITQQALPQLGESAKPEEIEDDWITDFFDKCRLISDQQMQRIWARLLAGEANKPGSVSRSTAAILASMDKSDAELFRKLCGFQWGPGVPTVLVYEIGDPIYNQRGIDYSSLAHLEDLGLIKLNTLTLFTLAGVQKRGIMSYFGHPVHMEFPNETGNELNTGRVLLSRAGRDIAQVTGAEPVPGFREYVMSRWRDAGLIVNEFGAPGFTPSQGEGGPATESQLGGASGQGQ